MSIRSQLAPTINRRLNLKEKFTPVTIDVSGDLIEDNEAKLKVILARQ
ncbi:MAG: hypothetical protein HGGPFJEG_01008 [Ignavibacteria bacterium]|nr:hypothetical protein [Ignavibacteria bacterium]